MTKIKLCGLRRLCDIEYSNELHPEYVGFVFAKESKRYISPEDAYTLRKHLNSGILPVGVFRNDDMKVILELANAGTIDIIQLHGNEDEEYMGQLRSLTDATIIKAFQIKSILDINKANECTADFVLLDSSGGSGETFNHSLISNMKRDYFLAGGMSVGNITEIIKNFRPFAVDVSSAIENVSGYKDKEKMAEFVSAVRKADRYDKYKR